VVVICAVVVDAVAICVVVGAVVIRVAAASFTDVSEGLKRPREGGDDIIGSIVEQDAEDKDADGKRRRVVHEEEVPEFGGTSNDWCVLVGSENDVDINVPVT
jgi:hypothetical protein